MDFPFLKVRCDFAANDLVSLGSCHCRLTITVATGNVTFDVGNDWVDRKRGAEALQIVCAQTWEHR
jgi:hypothetical protein